MHKVEDFGLNYEVVMAVVSESLCRCGSGKNYNSCCQPLHQGGMPPTALALMRSRYVAYAMGNVDYIVKTTHAENSQAHLPLHFQKRQILKFCQSTEFRGLEILEVQEGISSSMVTFRAVLSQKGADCSFIEKSLFKKENGFWFYLKGEVAF